MSQKKKHTKQKVVIDGDKPGNNKGKKENSSPEKPAEADLEAVNGEQTEEQNSQKFHYVVALFVLLVWGVMLYIVALSIHKQIHPTIEDLSDPPFVPPLIPDPHIHQPVEPPIIQPPVVVVPPTPPVEPPIIQPPVIQPPVDEPVDEPVVDKPVVPPPPVEIPIIPDEPVEILPVIIEPTVPDNTSSEEPPFAVYPVIPPDLPKTPDGQPIITPEPVTQPVIPDPDPTPNIPITPELVLNNTPPDEPEVPQPEPVPEPVTIIDRAIVLIKKTEAKIVQITYSLLLKAKDSWLTLRDFLASLW